MVKVRTVCKVEDCGNRVKTHGLCGKHLMRWKRHGHFNQTRPADWGQKEKHPLYGAWTWRRRKKTGTLCPEWHNDFWKFVSDVGKSPGANFKLRRLDSSKLYAPGNAEWVEATIRADASPSSRKERNRRQREYRKSDRGKRSFKNSSLKKMYGITLEVYERYLKSQKGVCAICGRPETAIHHVTKEVRDLAVDHCHKTADIRGLLCSKCNTGLGSFGDSRKMLQAAIRYLDTRTEL